MAAFLDEGPKFLDEETTNPAIEIGKGMLGGAEAGAELLPKMALGAAGIVTGALSSVVSRGLEGTTPSLNEAIEKGSEQSQKLTDWRLQESAKPTEQAIAHGLETAIDWVGRQAEDIARTIKPDEGGYPGIRTATEVATNFIPIGGIAGAAGKLGSKAIKLPEPKIGLPEGEIPYRAYDVSKEKIKTGEFDKTHTDTQIEPIDFDNVGAYTYKNKDVTGETSRTYATDIPGIDYTAIKLEDPAAIQVVQDRLSAHGFKADINHARQLASELEVKNATFDSQAQRIAPAITNRIAPVPNKKNIVADGYKEINASPMWDKVELVSTELLDMMRNTDRLSNPKAGFLDTERSVLLNGVNKGITLKYWPEEGRIVLADRNQVHAVAAKHGHAENPAYVQVMSGAVPEEFKTTAVSMPLKRDIKATGQLVKPSDIGLPSRTLNEGVFKPRIKHPIVPSVPSIKMPYLAFFNGRLSKWMSEYTNMTGQARNGLSLVAQVSDVPWYREVAKLLMEDKDFNPNISVYDKLSSKEGKEHAGQYDPHNYMVRIGNQYTGHEAVFVHEMVHARTHTLIEKAIRDELPEDHPAYKPAHRLISLWQNLDIDSSVVNKGSPGVSIGEKPINWIAEEYGMKNPHEFIAEAFSDPNFQSLLKQMVLPTSMQQRGIRYYWDAFIQGLYDLIGLKKGDQNYLSATLQAGAQLIQLSDKSDRMYYARTENPMNYQPDIVGVQMKDIVSAKTGYELDRRPLEQAWKEEGPKEFKDLSDTTHGKLLGRIWGGMQELGRNLADNKTIVALNKETPGLGLLLKNVSDRVEITNRWVRGSIDDALQGTRFKAKWYDPRGFEHREGSPDGVYPAFKSLPEKEQVEMMKTWLPEVGKKELTRGDFKNDKQWDAYDAIQNALAKGLKTVNSLRIKLNENLEPITPIQSFFPASRKPGDYKVVVKDFMGNQRYLGLYETVGQAESATKLLRKEFPYADISDPFHREPYAPRETDLSVWAEALRINSGDHELTQRIHQALSEKLGRMGAGGHFLERSKEAIGGFLGSDFNPRLAKEGLAQYFEHLYTYAGNLQKKTIQNELLQFKIGDESIAVSNPKAFDYLSQYLNKARGATNVLDESERIFFGKVTQALGFGASAPQRIMEKTASAAMLWYLSKAAFFGSQFFQPFNSLAKLVDVAQTVKGKSLMAVPEAAEHFWMGVQRTAFPDVEAVNGVNHITKQGYLDPNLAHMLDSNSDAGTMKRLFMKTSGTIEREIVRTPVFLAFESMLRDTVKNPEARYEQAAELMSRTMAMTSKANSPLLWDKLGIIGQGMKSLKSYSTNIWGQFAEYLGTAAGPDKRFQPLGTFLGTQVLVGGITGVIGVAEATALINLYNYWTNSTVETPTEYFLKKGYSDKLTYGMASTVTGRDINAQVGNPSGFNYFDPIPFKFGYDIVKANVEYAKDFLQNQLTDATRLKTWLANTPPQFHEVVRNMFAKQGQPIPNASLNMQGTYYRNEEQKFMSNVTGTRSIEEKKADDLQRFFKQHEQHIMSNRAETQNSMVDDILGGKNVDPSKIVNYLQQGGNPKGLTTDLKNTMIERNRISIYNQALSKARTPQEAQKLRDLPPYLNNLPSNISPSQGRFLDE